MTYTGGYADGYDATGAGGPGDPPVVLDAMPFYVEIDWDNDGNFSDPLEDVTELVRPNLGAVSFQYGRDQSSALAPTVSGQGQITLDNRDRWFSPRNTDSPLYGQVKPARPVRIARVVGGGAGDGVFTSGTTFILFHGYTDDSPINPDVNNRTVGVTMVDALALLRGQTISTPLYRDVRTGEAIGLILDACGWSVDLRDLDWGATLIPWWWEDNTDALTAIEKLVRSEGPPAMVTVGPEGELVFRDRHHRVTRNASMSVQSTWRGTPGIEPVMQTPFTYDEAWRNIINTGTVSVERRAAQPRTVVWTADFTISLAAGEQQTVTVTASDPFHSAVTPEVDVDYTALKGSVSVNLLRDSGLSTTIVLTAVGAAAVIANLQLRAIPVTVVNTVQVTANDPASVAEYGARSYPGELPWCSYLDAAAVLGIAVAQRAEPLPIVSARFVIGQNVGRGLAILPRDLSDRVRVIESETVLNDDFYIESIAHDFTGQYDHAITFGLEATPAVETSAFRFDSNGFDEGRFSNGLDDPSVLFRFDSSDPGHRFDDSVFAT